MTDASRAPRISLRDMTPDDAPLIREWVGKTWAWGDYRPVAFEQWLGDPCSVVRVAVLWGKRIVGVQHYQRLDADQCWLSSLRVHPDYRRKGVASYLLRDAVHIAQCDGLKVLRYATEAVNEVIHYLSETLKLEPRGTWLSFERTMDPLHCAARRLHPSLNERTRPLSPADKIRVLPILQASGCHFYVKGWAWRSLDDAMVTSLIEQDKAFLTRSDLGGWGLALLGHQDEAGVEATLYGTDAACVQTTLDYVTLIACRSEGVSLSIHVPQHGPAAGLMVDLARRGEWRHAHEQALRIWEYDLTRTRSHHLKRRAV
jgi:GNAT superfamily N-acetyltransferase